MYSMRIVQERSHARSRHIPSGHIPAAAAEEGSRAWLWLERVLEEQRQLYNAALQERVDCWRKTGKSLSWRDQFKSLTRCRHEIPGMEDIPVAIQRGTLKRLEDAMQGFFKRLENGSGAGFPRFKGRRRWNSISIVSGVRIRGNAIHVPRYGPMTVRRRGGNPYSRRSAEVGDTQARRREVVRRWSRSRSRRRCVRTTATRSAST